MVWLFKEKEEPKQHFPVSIIELMAVWHQVEATAHPPLLSTTRGTGPGAERPAVVSLLRVCAWESPVGSGGGAQRDLTTRNLRENRQS